APAALAPRTRRGRPRREETTPAPAATVEVPESVAAVPKTRSGGAAGVSAEVSMGAHPLGAAIVAGKSEADALAAFQQGCQAFLAADPSNVEHYMAALRKFGVKSARDVAADKRPEFIAFVKSAAGQPQAVAA
ncbi:MAG: hypothetical protein ABL897_00930, partial [Hyphomicrobium sp.]